MNILNATTFFDDKYTDFRNRIQYIEMCANYCVMLQLANLVSQCLYFVLTTIQNMNVGRKRKPNKNFNEKKSRMIKDEVFEIDEERSKIIEDEIFEVDNGRKETWL